MAKELVRQQLGNYRLVNLLGRGDFAEVYLGQHIRLSTQAAIKVLHTHLSAEKIKDFQQEAEMIAKLVHPHMAPEQIKLHRRRESDQYALAVVTYEWLAGKLPFLGTPEEIANKHLTIEPPSLRQKLPNLGVSVENVVFKALAKDLKQRFPS